MTVQYSAPWQGAATFFGCSPLPTWIRAGADTRIIPLAVLRSTPSCSASPAAQHYSSAFAEGAPVRAR